MHIQQIVLVCINVIGGIAVLVSYLHGFRTHPETKGDAWGHVPQSIKPLYTVSMLLAAAGYFLFTYYILFRLDPDEVRIADYFTFTLFPVLYALILVFSALWMPLTFAMLERPGRGLWVAIRLTLAIVGLASLGLLAALVGLQPGEPGVAYWLAIAGSAAFCLQTALLDALVWPVYFPR